WTHAGPLEPSLTATLDALHRAHATEGRTVLVHCAQGVSRSATLVVAYVMLKENWPWARAYAYVKSRSESVCPNVGLVGEVLAWD
ncbi:phosphatases II, partial [Caulochytrium protostelioides]